ncbi:TPA: TerD family protein [Clostridium botulinum]|nr:TerD family protein [Clostridium botulinum]
MGINLGNMNTGNKGSNPIGEQAGKSPESLLNLQKNDILDLTKRNPGLRKITVGLGWDVAQVGGTFDLDASAFLLDSNGKLTSTQRVCYFSNKDTKCGVILDQDNLTGEGEGDDEKIFVELDKIPDDVHKIVFTVTIYKGQEKRQNFGMVNHSYIRLLNSEQGDKELCKFCLTEDSSTSTALIFAEAYRNGSEWDFKAIGEGRIGDLNSLVSMYM